jgi:hypothetical protein
MAKIGHFWIILSHQSVVVVSNTGYYSVNILLWVLSVRLERVDAMPSSYQLAEAILACQCEPALGWCVLTC